MIKNHSLLFIACDCTKILTKFTFNTSKFILKNTPTAIGVIYLSKKRNQSKNS